MIKLNYIVNIACMQNKSIKIKRCFCSTKLSQSGNHTNIIWDIMSAKIALS